MAALIVLARPLAVRLRAMKGLWLALKEARCAFLAAASSSARTGDPSGNACVCRGGRSCICASPPLPAGAAAGLLTTCAPSADGAACCCGEPGDWAGSGGCGSQAGRQGLSIAALWKPVGSRDEGACDSSATPTGAGIKPVGRGAAGSSPAEPCGKVASASAAADQASAAWWRPGQQLPAASAGRSVA